MQNYKEYILNQRTEADIFRHYVPGFEGKPGSFINPLKPDEKNPSLSLYQHEGGKGWRFNAHNTGHQGDAFQLVADLKNIDSKAQFTAVCEAIAQDMNLTLPEPTSAAPEKIWKATVFPEIQDDAKRYFSQWGITPEILNRYGVEQVARLINGDKDFDYKSLGWLAIRYKAGKREKIRLPNARDKSKGWIQKSAKEPYLFGYAQVPEGAEALILCEGEKDVLTLAANGFFAVTAGSTQDKVTPAHFERIRAKNCPVFICYDTDEPGRKAAAEIAAKTGFPVIELPEIPGSKDISDYFGSGHTAADFSALMESAENRAGEKKKSGEISGNGTGAAADPRPAQEKKEGSAKGGTPAEEVRKLYQVKERDGQVHDITIDHVRFVERLQLLGFRSYDLEDKTTAFVKIADNIITRVSPVVIQRAFFDWLDAAPKSISGYEREKIKNKFYRGRDSFFSAGALSLLKKEDFTFCVDNRREIFFFYENGFVKCTAASWSLHPYSELQGHIWEEQIIRRRVNVLPATTEPHRRGVVAQFIYNVCGQDDKRFLQFSTLLGCLLHHYFETNNFAVILTDSSLKGADNGGTGKSLIAKLLGYMKPTANIDGKTFRTDNKFMFQTVQPSTQLVVLNDAPRNMDFAALYNVITEGITVEQKNRLPFLVRSKMLITTNMPIEGEGSSFRRRVKEAELSGHYSDKHTVIDDFPGKYFLSQEEEQFSAQDWDEYFNLVFHCCNTFLMMGIQAPAQINLNRRKLAIKTPEGFVEWMDYKIEQGKIKSGESLNIWGLHDQFLEAFPDNKLHMKWKQRRHFKRALLDYINYTDQLQDFVEEQDFHRNDNDQFIKINLK